eukprot:Plantae.Rhodophyta-Hildenbrandia_rubra.ctg6175.p1 GENE.Plantae.Rhodophyta-Hildenbrandia_rubra.ctg6175~~Plantae.Rhodophyta-Hildenbrandia_rubra.ctg6175.p1  ORF type:complete len:618 (-),score=82.16 Plantae.Rhodophyta-Hildenbrandia_rubra.ctg6175:491-2344(-)
MSIYLTPPDPSKDLLPSILHRYLSSKSPARLWLIAHDRIDDDNPDTPTPFSSSLKGVDISHAYTTTCTAFDAPDGEPNDLRVMHRMDDGFALGTAAAKNDKLLPYGKDPIAGNVNWAPMKWRRFASDLKVQGRCEYVEVGEMENGRWVVAVFIIQEGVAGAIGMNADVLYYDDANAIMNGANGADIVQRADMRVSLRGLDKVDDVCRFCTARGLLGVCECSDRMRKRGGGIPASAVIDPDKDSGTIDEERNSSVVAHGSSGLTLWDCFLERQRALDRVATVTYTVYQQNNPVFVNPFRFRLVYGKAKDTRNIAPIFLQRTTRGFKWARASPISRLADRPDRHPRQSSRENIILTNEDQDDLRKHDVVGNDLLESMCTTDRGPQLPGRAGNYLNSDFMSPLAPYAVSLVSDVHTRQEPIEVAMVGEADVVGEAPTSADDIVKKFPCDICDRSFDTKGHLSRHRRAVHEKKPALRCDYCDREFREEANRAHHMAVVHTDRRRTDGAAESDFRCTKCGFAFVRKYTLLRHVKLVHDKHRVKCHVCGREFGQRCDLKRHVIRVHRGEGLHKVADAQMTVGATPSSPVGSTSFLVSPQPVSTLALECGGPSSGMTSLFSLDN